MASEEVKKKLDEILKESSKKFGTDGIAVSGYEPKAIAIVLESISDVALMAKAVVEENDFKSKVDAIQFSGMLLDVLQSTCNRSMQALAIILHYYNAKEAKKN